MATIGSISIFLRTNTTALSKGLKKARGALNSFGSAAMSVKGALVGLAALGGVTVSLNALISNVNKARSELDSLAKTSDKLGILPDKLTALQHAAGLTGVETSTLNTALQRMVRRVSQAAQGTGEATAALKELGLDAQTMAGLSPDQQFLQIAKAMQGVSNQGDKVRLAFKLFDTEGVNLVNTLAQGEEGIKAMMQEAEDLGITFDRMELAKVEAANDAFDKLSKSLNAVFAEIAIQISPVIQDLADRFTGAAKQGLDFSSTVNQGLGWIVKGLSIVVDVVHTLHMAFRLVQVGVVKYLGFMIGAWAKLGQAIQFLVNKLPGVEVSFGTTLQEIANSVDDTANTMWSSLQEDFFEQTPGEKLLTWFDDVNNKADEMAKGVADATKPIHEMSDGMFQAAQDADKLIQKLQEQIDTFGMSSTEAEIFKLQQQGVSEETINTARALQAQLDKLESQAKLKETAQSVFEETRTPLEQFEARAQELRQLLEQGLIDKDTFARAINQAKENLPDEFQGFAGALSSGSQAARSAVLRNRFAGQKPMEKIEQNSTKQVDLLSKIHQAVSGIQLEETIITL